MNAAPHRPRRPDPHAHAAARRPARDHAQRPGAAARAAGWIGVVLQVLVGYPYLVSGLVVPGPWLFLLWAVWAGLLAVALWLRPRRPLLVPLVPLLSAGLWVAALALGEQLLGWQA